MGLTSRRMGLSRVASELFLPQGLFSSSNKTRKTERPFAEYVLCAKICASFFMHISFTLHNP